MKRFFVLITLVLTGVFSYAQLYFGVKAGYNSSLGFNSMSMIGDKTYTLEDVKAEMWNNFHAGLFARIFVDKLYLQPELLYSMQKKDYTMQDVLVDGNATNVETYMEINTVTIPVYLGYKLLDVKVASLRVFAGPKFIMNAGSSLEYRNLTRQQIDGSVLVEEFKNAQVDLEAGAGLDVFMFALEAKVNLIQDIRSDNHESPGQSLLSVPTSNFIISLAWKIF